MRWMAYTLSTALLWSFCVQAQNSNVDVRVANHDGLKQIIQANHGKVVWIDFWMLACRPCKERFPHIIEMQKKHGKDGLVVITVCTDAPEQRALAVSYLNGVNANCVNVLFDDSVDVLEKKLRVTSFPTYYVFDRQGKWVRFTDNINYDAVDRLLLQLLNEK